MKENDNGNDTNVSSMENSIEKNIKKLEEDIKSINKGLYELEDSYELHQARWAKRIFENIKQKLGHILSDYKRVLKENEELKEDRDKFKKALGKRITYCNELEKDLFENCSNYVIPKQIVKDKIEELKKNLYTVEHYETVGAIHALQELIKERE